MIGSCDENPFGVVRHVACIDRIDDRQQPCCAIKHPPLRVQFDYQHNTQKAIEAGIKKDPTLVLDGEIFLAGLPQAEQISEAFEKKLKRGV